MPIPALKSGFGNHINIDHGFILSDAQEDITLYTVI